MDILKTNVIFFLLVGLVSFDKMRSQNYSGEVHYIVNTQGVYSDKISQESKDRKEARLKKLYYKETLLKFDDARSFYKEKQTLETEKNSFYRKGFLNGIGAYHSDGIYKNTDSKEMIEEREFLGKLFLVSDSIADLKWDITKESKKIGEYIVIKATTNKKINVGNVMMPRFNSNEVRPDVIVTAWFTPQIPIPLGPDVYHGLPGLILEVNVHRTTILCEKIVVNTDEELIIQPSKKGEEVSLTQFEKIVGNKLQEQRDMLKN